MTREYKHWINGTWAVADSGQTIERHSPAHGERLASFAAGNAVDVDKAVDAAYQLFDSRAWSSVPANEKSKLLHRWADLIERDTEKLARIEAEEVGKPIMFARGEIAAGIEMVRYAASLVWQLPGEVHNQLGDDKLGLVTREARGVVAMIVPWNFPMVTLFQKLPYALAAGCSTVIKPSELTSGTALEVAKLSEEAGLPAGLINVVTGTGLDVGDRLSSHPKVAMISFTGSTRVGKQIAAKAADDMRRVSLELGGKAANVVFADADLDAALDGVLFGTILNQGEECVAGTRLLIEESVADTFVRRLVERAKKVQMGMPLDESCQLTAMIHEGQMNSVLDYIRVGKEEGATLAVGGDRVVDGDFGKGYFINTTIFTDVTPGMRIFRDEIFGPVLTVTTFKDQEEAIRLANDTEYGLGNGLWTKDVDKAIQVSQRLKSGTVFVNTYLETAVQMPFGGFKQSGIGRENGLEGLLEFTEIKSTFIKMSKRTPVLPNTVD
ncbi:MULTISPECIES: aldehyde dehydrogenase family protein [Halomonas]|uniref:aldehyde dehydrogenase family protein n=1 Tax=Halomonas TaxID=2745 RepID=UPI001C96BE24|nr:MULTISPECIES: aldehyde dehydrogenase family protein [Halomonas]MBY6208637.1 aldehyde dehydrogenase family protein [Halomonas sp. DP3Y7-2]MBY6227108.1 aldehyde dehydrogenase family protein [Halomonas sp. DP3Y7-1]MCA0915143.1 aldehyde dehydrogenase family protein [Halomonas denitrificans]